MDVRARWIVIAIVGVLAVGGIGFAIGFIGGSSGPAQATVTITSPDGEPRGSVDARVAATWWERYVGLSRTDDLGPNEGMVFVHDTEDEYAYVMRGMDFPIDIVFIDADGRITMIHHAEPESWPYTEYRGRGKWVLEVPGRWTTQHNVTQGDRVTIDRHN